MNNEQEQTSQKSAEVKQADAAAVEPPWCRAALDALADAAFLVDHDSLRVVDANRSACDKLGYSWDNLLANGLTRVFPYLKSEDLANRNPDEQHGDHRTAMGRPWLPTVLPTIMCHQDGTELLVELSVHPLDSTPAPRLVCLARVHGDATAALSQSVFHDPLTNLPDRRIFERRLQQACDRAGRESKYCFAVLFIDIDGFKAVNDRHGHTGGDRLLRTVAQRLSASVRSNDLVSRFGGDEFTVLVDEIASETDAITVAERIQRDLDGPFTIRGGAMTVRASIGIVLGNAAAGGPQELLDAADMAMYRVKAAGGDGYAIDAWAIDALDQQRTA